MKINQNDRIAEQKNNVSKLHGKVSERDGRAKVEVLLPLVSNPNGLSFNELRNVSTYKYKDNSQYFGSLLSKYKHRGYVTVSGTRRNYIYKLTERGNREVTDPMWYRRVRVERHNEIMKNARQNRKTKTEYVYVDREGNTIGSGSDGYAGNHTKDGFRDLGDENYHKMDVNELQNKINDMSPIIKDVKDVSEYEILNKTQGMTNLEKDKVIVQLINELDIEKKKMYVPKIPLGDSKENKNETPAYYETMVKFANKYESNNKKQTILHGLSEKNYKIIPFSMIELTKDNTISGIKYRKGTIRCESHVIAGAYVKREDANYIDYDKLVKGKFALYYEQVEQNRKVNYFYFYNGNRYDIVQINARLAIQIQKNQKL